MREGKMLINLTPAPHLPLSDWLTKEQIFNLAPVADPQEMGQLLQPILG